MLASGLDKAPLSYMIYSTLFMTPFCEGGAVFYCLEENWQQQNQFLLLQCVWIGFNPLYCKVIYFLPLLCNLFGWISIPVLYEYCKGLTTESVHFFLADDFTILLSLQTSGLCIIEFATFN